MEWEELSHSGPDCVRNANITIWEITDHKYKVMDEIFVRWDTQIISSYLILLHSYLKNIDNVYVYFLQINQFNDPITISKFESELFIPYIITFINIIMQKYV